jgi:hypothetical protein
MSNTKITEACTDYIYSIPTGYTAKIEGNQITFEPVKPKYPTWKDAIINVEQLIMYNSDKPSWVYDEVQTTLKRLQWLRNEWNRIDGFVVDWEEFGKEKYFIAHNQNEPFIYDCYHNHHFLYFQSEPTAQLFLDTFRDKIEVAKEFVNL